ncbi:hypothetical protein DFH06DRAFT_630155 [Mycena polygramma]|nr:hypothetical protein DFH06DRAFT_630155 [Mycena polygramma]
MSGDSASIRDSPAPFSAVVDPENDSHPPDFILRSRDSVDFHVHREIMKFASDCFDGMFAMPGGDGDPNGLRRDGKPVLILPEPAPVLYRLLRLAYPATSTAPYTLRQPDLDHVVAVYNAAHKYQFIRVQTLLREMLSTSSLLAEQSHRFYAIGKLIDYPNLMRRAALSTLTSSGATKHPAFPEMGLLTWADAHKLSEFIELCGSKGEELVDLHLSPFSFHEITIGGTVFKCRRRDPTKRLFPWWIAAGHSTDCSGDCTYPRTDGDDDLHVCPTKWFRTRLEKVAAQLRVRPSHSTVKAVGELSVLDPEYDIIKACPVCQREAVVHFSQLLDVMEADVKRSNEILAKSHF